MKRSNDCRPLPEVVDFISQNAVFFTTFGNDYHVSHLELTPEMIDNPGLKEPMSFPGLSFVMVTSGELEMELNTEVHLIPTGSMLVTDSRTLQKIKSVKAPKTVVYILFLTQEFLKSLNLDINVLRNAHIRTSTEPVILDVKGSADMLTGYMRMLNENATNNNPSSIYTKNISRSLIAALCYQMLQIADNNYVTDVSSRVVSSTAKTSGPRRINYVKAFMELIHEHYARERSLGFYADKLCISPKYLSAIIKECTNRSAVEWIDEYVMIEAKNMLRFSGMNIQQVAYALNFRNQSAFGKYFKHLSGMSPSQFQKS